MLQKLIDTLKDAKEKAPYHVRFHVKDNTWEVWEIGEQTRAIIINASHEEAENICEEYINKFIVKKLVEVLKEPTHNMISAAIMKRPYIIDSEIIDCYKAMLSKIV